MAWRKVGDGLVGGGGGEGENSKSNDTGARKGRPLTVTKLASSLFRNILH